MKLLTNKNAVITGGSEGIGLGIARSFAQNGANLILIGRNIEKLKMAKEELSAYKTKIHILSADLSNTDNIINLCKEILAIFAGIDILVNNAGTGKFIPFSETEISLFDLHLNLNIRTPYFLTQQLLSSLIKNRGNVINISSYFSHKMLPGRTTTAYSITKGALDSFTKSLAFEIGHLGVRVNSIAPGSILTPQFNNNLQDLSDDKQTAFYEMVKNIYPLGRIGTPKDIGSAALFLASEQAEWITGAIFAVDGGLTTN